jgi:hypothetical protein
VKSRGAILHVAALAIGTLVILIHAASAADLAGWHGTAWGMSAAEVDAALGDAVKPVDPPLVYGGASAAREVPDVDVAGYGYRALLQFSSDDGRLQQVLLERSRRPDASKAYAAALDAFITAFGEPTFVCNSPRTGEHASPITRERVWRLPTTTVHLVFIDFSGGSLQYDSLQDIDPLVPERERRLHSTRSYPQRLLVRYHPSGRDDLLSEGCGR